MAGLCDCGVGVVVCVGWKGVWCLLSAHHPCCGVHFRGVCIVMAVCDDSACLVLIRWCSAFVPWLVQRVACECRGRVACCCVGCAAEVRWCVLSCTVVCAVLLRRTVVCALSHGAVCGMCTVE